MSTLYQTSDNRVETYAGCSAAGLLISQRNGEVDGQTNGHQTNAYKRAERSLHFWLICYLDTLGIISHSGLCHTTFATFSNVFTCAMLCSHGTSRGLVSVSHKSVFYRNGWTNRVGFWHILHCVKRKFRNPPNTDTSLWNLPPITKYLDLQNFASLLLGEVAWWQLRSVLSLFISVL